MPSRLSTRQQGLVVAGLGAAALVLALLVFGGSEGRTQPGPPAAAQFVPDDQQLKSFGVQTVALHAFRTEIVTDGMIAAGASARSGAGQPVLPGQASDMLQAENDLAAAHVQYRNAAAAQDRQHKLYLSQGAALKDWQQSQVDLATAASALATARNKLRLLGKGDDGKTGAVMVEGNGAVWLIASVREADAGLVHVGDTLSARLPARSVSGRIGFISTVIDPATHRLAVGARIANPGGALKPNMLATVEITGGAIRQAPAVPRNAMIYDGDQAHVWVVGAGRRLEARAVTPGVSSDGLVEIAAGLKPGEHIATAGSLFIDQAVSGD